MIHKAAALTARASRLYTSSMGRRAGLLYVRALPLVVKASGPPPRLERPPRGTFLFADA
jgi:hypothetical protein